MTEPLVHVAASQAVGRSLAARLGSPDGLRVEIEGAGVATAADFLERIDRAMPLIRGFGRNLDALVDLLRTAGWRDYAGKAHVLVWYQPEDLLVASPEEFSQIVDIVVGVAKELLVGEEIDRGPEEGNEWSPTRLDVVFACNDSRAAESVARVASRLSQSWADEFRSLKVPVHRAY